MRRAVAELGETNWMGSDGELRHELDFLVEVDGDLSAPRLEMPKHVEFAWVGADDLDRLMENRGPEETLVREIVARGLHKAAELGGSEAKDAATGEARGREAAAEAG